MLQDGTFGQETHGADVAVNFFLFNSGQVLDVVLICRIFIIYEKREGKL